MHLVSKLAAASLLVGVCHSSFGREIETITVTASRTATPVDNVGSSITILDREDVKQSGSATLAGLLRNVPGFAMSQQGGLGTFAQARVRGAEANHVLVLIDGVEANDVAQGSEFNFAHLLTSGIERVEVVRGPQSALWGSDALAGVVNVITTPASSRSGVEGHLEGGSFGMKNGGLRLSRAGDTGSLWVSADRVDTDGTNISRTGTEDDGYRNTTLSAGGQLQLARDADLKVMIRNTDSVTGFDDVDYLYTGLPIDAPFTTDSAQTYAKASLSYRPVDRFEQIVTLSRSDTENVNHTNASVDDVTTGIRDSLHLQSNFYFARQTLTLLAEHEREHFGQRGEATIYGDPNKDLDTITNSLAAEWRFDGDLFDVSVSARHDNNSEFDNADTWQVTGLWHLAEATAVYASAGRSNKNPTFTERFGYFDTFTGNPALTPEFSFAKEIGIRQRFDDARILVDASYFTARLTDEIDGFVFDGSTGTFTAANSDGVSTRRGVEISANWQVDNAFTLDGNATWLDATEPGGTREIRRPEQMATLRASYAFERGSISLGANYSSKQQDDFFPPYPPYQERVDLPGYTLVHLSGQYRVSQHATLTARIENLTDRTVEDVIGFREPGAAAYLGVRVSL
ncbi:MAG: TonB-dependent receptor [Pseudomonadales bacterium]|nr:TonB-dependent receptor [Pseudomonadales bacterium]